MIKRLLLVVLVASIFSIDAMSQCGRVSLIGEFNGWADDLFMTRDPESPNDFTAFITVDQGDDTDTNGVVEMKFRENADWAVNWGNSDFPAGTAIADGPNIPVTYGTWLVAFNCETGVYLFTSTCGAVSLIGEFNGWAGDHNMERDMNDPDSWTAYLSVDASDDPDTNGIVEMKFRENAGWTVNWGSDEFPAGTATQDGPNIPVPYGNYKIFFNCGTGAYEFVSTCGEIALIGEFNGWADDYWMMRDMANPDMWKVILTLDDDSDPDTNGIVEMKFRQNSDWGVNWGSDAFPSGTATQDGPNIPVPLDDVGITTDYLVTFNCATGEYNFQATSGSISMIGAFNNWNGDVPMNRDAVNPDLWTLTRSWDKDYEVKFRENNDWTHNWGNNTWPTGIGTDNGPNIPLVGGSYDVTFNAGTGEYSFVENNTVCGEIGMVGEFNEWGGSGDYPTDVWLVRDPVYPSLFSLTYNFASSTLMYFRLNAQDITNETIWGGTSLCQTGLHDVTKQISVPGGLYHITFNCLSGDYCFQQLGNSVKIPKVFAITVDGFLDETDWDISQSVSKVIDGTPGDDMNEVTFGATYNEDYLFVGINIKDAFPQAFDNGEIFIDGDKSGGPLDDHDVHLKFSALGLEVIHGPAGISIPWGFQPGLEGFTAEVGIPWADLGVTPEEGGLIGLDIFNGDDDTGTEVQYILAWNGNLGNYESASSYGDGSLGVLSCGCISIYSEAIGDVVLRNPTDMPTKYVGSYNLDDDRSLLFRKDGQDAVTWGSDAFPSGTATVGGDMIPGTTGRYRVEFDCITGEYDFANNPAGDHVAYANYTNTPPVIDGDLDEYSLDYDMAAGNVTGVEPVNNTVAWGALWDGDNLYIGAQVTDAIVEGSGNPWDNDAIEMYIDGNHDRDGTYDSDFDTQLILDALNESTLWVKADGVPITVEESIWVITDDGYNIEISLGWVNFDFAPGRGRSIGWSIGNNDSDLGLGRDYQAMWYGTSSNWSNTADLGDLELAGGPYFFGVDEIEDFGSFVVMYPNPATTTVYLRLTENVFNGNVTIYITDLSGRLVSQQSARFHGANDQFQIDISRFTPGIYFINIIGENNMRTVKKLIVR